MQNRKVTFETATLAKEKGFDVWCQECYDSGKILPTNNYSRDHIFAPTQSLLQKWLRVEHQIHITVTDLGISLWSTLITELMDGGTKSIGGKLGKENFKNYEEALENGLQEALKLINND